MAGKPVGEVISLKVGRSIWRRQMHMAKKLPKDWLDKTKETGCKNRLK